MISSQSVQYNIGPTDSFIEIIEVFAQAREMFHNLARAGARRVDGSRDSNLRCPARSTPPEKIRAV